MSNFIPLENVRVASPCRADWNKMEGDDRARFCQSCAKNVYNLSDMSKAQAEALLQEKEGNLCVRFYQRADGTIITDNCPVGLKIVRRPFKWLMAGFAFFITSGTALFGGQARGSTTAMPSSSAFNVRSLAPMRFVMDRFDSGSEIQGDISIIVGEPVCPAPEPEPTPTPEPTPDPKE